MLRNGDPDGKSAEASGSKLVKQSSKEAQTDRPQGKPQSLRKPRSPPKRGGAGPSRRGPTTSRSVSNLNPFSCWAGSQIQVEDESPISIADKIAAAVDSGVLQQPQESWDRNKTPRQEDKSTKEPQSSEHIGRPAWVGAGSGASVVAIGSSSSRSADSPPRDCYPLPSPGSDREPRPGSTSRAHGRGIVESSEPRSTSNSTSRERIIVVPATTNPTSSPRHKNTSAENSASTSTSKLAIACACHKEKGLAKGQSGSQKSKVEARMSRGSGPGPGRGSSRGNENDQEPRRDNVVGLRAPRRANAEAGPSRRVRSTSPIPDQTEWGDDNDRNALYALVQGPPALKSFRSAEWRDDNDSNARSALVAKLSPPPTVATPRGNVLVQAPVALGRRANAGKRKVGPSPRKASKADVKAKRVQGEAGFRVDAVELGNEYHQDERRRKMVAAGLGKSPKTGNEEQRRQGDPATIDNFRLSNGDMILRHKKWPTEPMIVFLHSGEQGQILREHDHVLRNTLHFDRRTDSLLCKAWLWRASLVEVADAHGDIALDLRLNEVGCAQISFDKFKSRRDNQDKHIFGRRFEAAGFSKDNAQ